MIDPIAEIENLTIPMEVVACQPKGVSLNARNTTPDEVVTIRGKAYVGKGIPSNDNRTVGIDINAPVREVNIIGCQLSNLAEGIVIQQRDATKPPIEVVRIIGCCIRNIFNTTPTNDQHGHDTRGQGAFFYNVKRVEYWNTYTDYIGWRDEPKEFDTRDDRSHGIYVNLTAYNTELFVRNSIFRRCAMQGINAGPSDLDGVICASNAVNFLTKGGSASRLQNTWSITPYTDELTNGNVMGLHYNGSHGHYHDDTVHSLDTDPIDWGVVDGAKWGEWYDVARSYLSPPVENAPHTPPTDGASEPTEPTPNPDAMTVEQYVAWSREHQPNADAHRNRIENRIDANAARIRELAESLGVTLTTPEVPR